MKGVILAAGEGKRLRPLTYDRPKVLLPVGGTPVLDRLLISFKNAKIKDVIVIVNYLKDKIVERYSDGKFGLNIQFVEQKEPKGTADAISLASKFTENEDFIVVNGDILTDESEIKNIINFHISNSPLCTMGVTKVENPSLYGVIESNKDKLIRIIEKPKNIKAPSYINAGVMVFNPEIFTYIEKTPLSERGEFEITKSIELAVNDNKDVLIFEFNSWWVDIGTPWDLLEANKLVISNIEEDIQGVIEDGAHVKGPIILKKNAVIRSGAYIEGPIIIDENADVGPNCYIRPYTYIGRKVRIGNACEIKNSIILDGTHVGHLSYVGDSIIGENVNFGAGTIIANLRFDDGPVYMEIKGNRISSGRRKLGAVVGDRCKTGIGVSIIPGIKIGVDTVVYPHSLVTVDIPNGKMFKTKFSGNVLSEWKKTI